MKILVLGLSPYLLTSRSKVAALILRYLYIKEFDIAGAVWGHDPEYFVPDDDGRSYYEFPINGHGTHRIPLFLFHRGEKEALEVHEIIRSADPDLVITVGDYGDFLYMSAVKAFYTKPLKWLFVLLNYSSPINKDYYGLVNSTDGILCTSKSAYDAVASFYKQDIIDIAYLGSSYKYVPQDDTDKFRIIASGKNHQADNLPSVIEAVSQVIYKNNINMELYLHTAIHENGDYNIEDIAKDFDPHGKFIRFPDKYVSLYEGLSDGEMAIEMSKSHVFVSMSLVSASSMSVFDAISCGCYPLISDCGSNRNIANEIYSCSPEYNPGDFLIPTVKLMSSGGSYLHIPDIDALAEKILFLSEIYEKNKGKGKVFSEFIDRKSVLGTDSDYKQKHEEASPMGESMMHGSRFLIEKFTEGHKREGFLNKLSEMIDRVEKSDPTVCLDT